MTGVEVAMIGSTAITLGDVAMVAGALGTISSAVGAQKNAAFNARLNEQNARLARETSASEEEDFRRDARRARGSQLVALGAAGVDSEAGTALDLQGLGAAEAELTARRIRHAGEVDAARQTATAAAERFRGESEFRSGLFKAGSTLLTAGQNIGARPKKKMGP